MLGEILGAVGSIAGGLLGNSAAKKANKQQAALAAQNRTDQYNFAQNSIQWKAADAEKAGISKVFAMGASPMSFSPVSTGSTPANFDFLGSAGQNIGRAMAATQSPGQQQGAIPRAAAAIQLEGLQLDNEFKRAQIASLNKNLTQAGQPPGIPTLNTPYGIPGQPFTTNPAEVSANTKMDVSDPRSPGLTPYSTPENLRVATASGGTVLMPAPAVQEALESMGFLAQRQAEMRNIGAPLFFDKYRPQGFRAGDVPGYHTRYNPLTGEYKLKKTKPYHNPRSR